jgi:UDP-2,4-diacetamido-2,4,6-trideoxy-beta-L-altropyranose hydrolase
MKIISSVTFIVDISKEVGKGHFSRCRALYENLLLSGLDPKEVTWVLVGLTDLDLKQEFPELDMSNIEKVNSKVLKKKFLLLDTQWVIIDLPKLDFHGYEDALPKNTKTLLIVDRPVGNYSVDILVAPNLFLTKNSQTIMELNKNSECLMGPEWFPLRPEFYKKRKNGSKPYPSIDRIRIGAYFGGLDAENQVDKVYKASQILNSSEIEFDLIAGSETRLEMHTDISESIKLSLKKSDFPEYLSSCDLFIGSLGVSAWERSYLRIPTITSFQNDNQFQDYEVMLNMNAIYGIGHAEEYSSFELAEAIERLISDELLLESLRNNSEAVMRENELKSSILISQVLNFT